MTEDFDVLIRDARVLDGENPPFKGSIGIRGGASQPYARSRGAPRG